VHYRAEPRSPERKAYAMLLAEYVVAPVDDPSFKPKLLIFSIASLIVDRDECIVAFVAEAALLAAAARMRLFSAAAAAAREH